MTNDKWAKFGDLICSVLTTIYVDGREVFEEQASSMNATLEQLAAAAITQILRERLELGNRQRSGQNHETSPSSN